MDKQGGYTVRPHTRVRQKGVRGAYDKDTIHAILDEAWVAHVGFVHDDRPVVIPVYCVRDGESILIHGSRKARIFKTLGTGVPLSFCVTLVDGLVCARSHFHHSMNYRSVVGFGAAQVLKGAQKARALDIIIERYQKGRARRARAGNAQEMKATMILRIPLDEVSAKVRAGGVVDDAQDMNRAVWAGVIPMHTIYGAPQPDGEMADGLVAPAPR